MLYFATAEQRATIKRLSTEVIWQTAFNDWLETRFGRDHSIDPRDGAKVVIDALKSKLRNQKRGMAISDWKQPASADQLAMIKRLVNAVRWDTAFHGWLWKTCGLQQVELYGQAEQVIYELKGKLKAQLFGHDRGRTDHEQDLPRRECAYHR